MIETIASVGLPVGEVLEIKKNRIVPVHGLSGKEKRISIVTGIHGDELEGQYVCFELLKRIRSEMDKLSGIVDIYPAMNPLGIDSITRGIPAFDLDMNRLFPGNRDGDMTEYLADKIMEDLTGADVCIDIHASNIYLTEIPQIRINELHKDMLVPLAVKTNVDFIWVHGANTVLEATLAHSLNSRKTPTLVVEMGVGMRITKAYCMQLVDGIMNLMREMGIWQGETKEPRKPIISQSPEDVSYLNAPVAGVFVPEVKHWEKLKEKDLIGTIIDPLRGEILAEILSPVNGYLFTIREYPVVDAGSLIGRLLREDVRG
ncbi:MAG: M14 family metallopeptidase [Bacillus sp. (in: Bacteria)]|nr:M14 family metallopeptidase [Bacillus sp. (in: firmicutes)]MCM1426531.1 M14 family metallopeptidase [Eubacterium sp.]